MGNEQDRSIHRLDRIKDLIFGNRIECRCYFIKQIKIGFSQKRSCDRDPLHLSLRKVLLSKHIKVRIIAMGQTFDSFVQTDFFGRFFDGLFAGAAIAHPDFSRIVPVNKEGS